jgi:hypothetical protein
MMFTEKAQQFEEHTPDLDFTEVQMSVFLNDVGYINLLSSELAI